MARDKGKRRGSPPFVMVDKLMLRSTAWLDLTNAARVAWLHIAAEQNGRNHDALKMPYSQAAKLMTRNTFSKALQDLKAHGFITVMRQGGLLNNPTEFALDQSWKSWTPDKK